MKSIINIIVVTHLKSAFWCTIVISHNFRLSINFFCLDIVKKFVQNICKSDHFKLWWRGRFLENCYILLIIYINNCFQLFILFVLLCHLHLSFLRHSRCIVPITSDLWCYFHLLARVIIRYPAQQHEGAQSQPAEPWSSDSGTFVHIRCGSAAEMISFQSRGVWWSIAVTLIAVSCRYSHWMSFWRS